MANNVVKFPKSPSIEQRIEMKQHRLKELETENDYVSADIEHLTRLHSKNMDEYGKVVKELSALWKIVAPEEESIEFEADFDSDFDFEFDFNPDEE